MSLSEEHVNDGSSRSNADGSVGLRLGIPAGKVSPLAIVGCGSGNTC
jgi:hypothetical protein